MAFLSPLGLPKQLQTEAISPSLLLLLFLVSLVLLLKRSRRGKLKLPPSPPKLPIIGNLHQLLGTLPHRALKALSQHYGPLMFVYFGHSPTLVVSSVDMATELFKAHEIVISNRPKTTAAKIFVYDCRDVAFSPYGEYWRQIRKISVLELLSMRRVQSFQHVRDEEVSCLINKIRCSCSDRSSVNLSEMLLAISNNIVSRCVLGRKVEEENGTTKFGELSRRLMVQFTAFCFGDIFPSLGWLDVLTGFTGRLNATARALDAMLDQVIEEHRISESSDHDRKDFVDILLQLQKDGMLGTGLTQDNLKAILLDMFVGGTDTTATALEWTITELIRNPCVMKRAQEEVRSVVKAGKLNIETNDLVHMDYLKCVIKEALRLHPPLPLLLPRETSESVKWRGYDIPAKTRVFVNAWAIQRDPEIWDRPEEFLPERFVNNPFDCKGQDFQFIPFGAGRRGCPGMTFALTTLEYVIANLLYWFDWKLPDAAARARGEFEEEIDLDISEGFGLTAYKKFPLHAVPTFYSP